MSGDKSANTSRKAFGPPVEIPRAISSILPGSLTGVIVSIFLGGATHPGVKKLFGMRFSASIFDVSEISFSGSTFLS